MSNSVSRRLVVLVGYLTTVALAACGGGSDDKGAILTVPVHHMETQSALAGADLQVEAIDYLRSFEDALDLGLSANDEYDVTAMSDKDGIRHVRVQQTYAGVPVVGSEIVVHAGDATFLGFNGTVTKNLDGFDITMTVSDGEALALAQADHGGRLYSDESSQLVILPDLDGEGATLAWRTRFFSPKHDAVDAGLWNYYIDARSGALIRSYNDMHTVDQASGPGGNAKRSWNWDTEIDVEPDGDEFKMDTEQFKTVDLANSEEVVKGPLENMEDPTANDAQGFAEVTLDMMRSWMGRDSIDDNGFKIISRVHDTSNCPGAPRNACWNGTVMTYGDGAADRHPYSGALDCVAHELNHGFTTFHSNLAYENQSGGLNENFSDVAGTVAEFYHEGDGGDFTIFEDIAIGVDASRWMCEPATGGQIDDAGDFDVAMGPHTTSGPPNRAFCLAVGRYKAVGDGSTTTTAVRTMGHVWYTANASYYTSATTYQQACRATIDAARALGHDAEMVEALAASWADVGVDCDSGTNVCDDDGTCDIADGETCASCAEDCDSCAQPCGWYKKALCAAGIGDCSQCGEDSGCGDGICDGDETDENCAQDCGCAAFDCEDIAPYGCWCDDACLEIGDCCADREGTCQ